MNRNRRKEAPPAIRVILAVLVFMMPLFVLSGCAAVGDPVDTVSDTITDAFMDSSSSLMDAWSSQESKSMLEGLAASSGLSKNGAIRIASDNGDRIFEKTEASELISRLDLDKWEPVASESFKRETADKPASVRMIISQDETVLLGEDEPSGRVDVASIMFWPEERMARYDVTINDGEGVYLFEDIGITTKERSSLLTSYFRIPAAVAEYVVEL